MNFLCGVAGFIGFEGLRVYKCLWNRRPIAPAPRIWWYLCAVILIAAFSGVVAMAVNPKNLLEAIYLGFSVPCGVRTILEPGGRRKSIDHDIVDDIVVESSGFLGYLRGSYFLFY